MPIVIPVIITEIFNFVSIAITVTASIITLLDNLTKINNKLTLLGGY